MTTKLIENYTQKDLKEYCLYDTIDFDSFSTKEWAYFISLINDSKTEKTMKEYYQTSAIDYIYITRNTFKSESGKLSMFQQSSYQQQNFQYFYSFTYMGHLNNTKKNWVF